MWAVLCVAEVSTSTRLSPVMERNKEVMEVERLLE
jgi:hypothetical protein